jgi:hypothetical protein
MSTESMFTPHPDVVFRDLQGEAVILHLGTGTYFGLDEVGTRAWQLLAEHNTLAQVCGRLAEEFDAPVDRIERDVTALVDQLLAKDLIRASA